MSNYLLEKNRQQLEKLTEKIAELTTNPSLVQKKANIHAKKQTKNGKIQQVKTLTRQLKEITNIVKIHSGMEVKEENEFNGWVNFLDNSSNSLDNWIKIKNPGEDPYCIYEVIASGLLYNRYIKKYEFNKMKKELRMILAYIILNDATIEEVHELLHHGLEENYLDNSYLNLFEQDLRLSLAKKVMKNCAFSSLGVVNLLNKKYFEPQDIYINMYLDKFDHIVPYNSILEKNVTINILKSTSRYTFMIKKYT